MEIFQVCFRDIYRILIMQIIIPIIIYIRHNFYCMCERDISVTVNNDDGHKTLPGSVQYVGDLMISLHVIALPTDVCY